MEQSLFRKKTMERISSPEQLSDYLKVTNPGIWIVLAAVIFLLVGIAAWSAIGTLETKADAKALVQDGAAQVIVMEVDSAEIKAGMPLRVASQEEGVISNVGEDEYGRVIAFANVSLPNGTYDAEIITEQIHPIRFLFESR